MNIEFLNNTFGKYLKLTQNGNTFNILFGGNLDLYFQPVMNRMELFTSDEHLEFKISKEDGFLYEAFMHLYEKIINYIPLEEMDSKREREYQKLKDSYRPFPLVHDKVISWHSDEEDVDTSSILNISKLEITSRDLKQSQLYNKTLTVLHDNIRAFKHDFHNIVHALGGYIDTEDIEGLKKYYQQLLNDCQCTNNLTGLSPSTINNPAIYNVLASKYHKADELGIKINLEVFLDLNEIESHMKIYEFARILGILFDNAIEATKECDKKLINLTIRKDLNKNRLLLIVENTYKNKDVDTEKIYEKGFSTKPGNSGLGLWKVRQILIRNNNLNLFTTKNDEYFKQQLEIY